MSSGQSDNYYPVSSQRIKFLKIWSSFAPDAKENRIYDTIIGV